MTLSKLLSHYLGSLSW